MLDPLFLTLFENRIYLVHFFNKSVEPSFEDVYDSSFHVCCLGLYYVVVASFKQSYLVIGKEIFWDLDGWSCIGPFAVLVYVWNDCHVGHGSVTIGVLLFSFSGRGCSYSDGHSFVKSAKVPKVERILLFDLAMCVTNGAEMYAVMN